MNGPIDLRPDHEELLRAILHDHLPDARIWVFGSRAKWSAKPHSDLDLAIEAKAPIASNVMAELAEALDDSDLPFRVDAVDMLSIEPSFLDVIRRDRVGLVPGWQMVSLSYLIEPGQKISYGIVQPGTPVADGVPVLRVSDIRNGRISTDRPLRVAPAIEAPYVRTRLKGGELLLTLVGTVGEMAVVPPQLAGWNIARAIGRLPIRKDVGPYWAKLALGTPAARSRIRSRLNTTVQATLNLADVAELPVPLPPPGLRAQIIDFARALDDRIELNRRMNETLEAMARAIFKDWFVDFGPTRAKIEGRASYLAPDIWALFPGRLDDEGSPNGWATFSLEAIAAQIKGSVSPGDDPHTTFEHFSLPAFDIDQSPALDLGSSIKSNKTPVPDGAILLSKLNPETSRVWLPGCRAENPQIASTEFLAFLPRKPASRGLLYCLFRSEPFRQLLTGMVTGTSKSHQRISPPALMGQHVMVGEEKAFAQFDLTVRPLLQKQLANRLESRTLAAMRDLLLPKLMSGAIRIRDAEAMVADA